MAIKKRRAEPYFNGRVRTRSFEEEDLVLRGTGVTIQEEEKLGPKWEGPYVLTAYRRPRAYELKYNKRKKLPRPWNVGHLKKHYV